jgi:hypothetical protein
MANLNPRGADAGLDGAIDYGREARAAENLMQIQLKNANQLMRARQELQQKLFDEARKEGKALEDYLAQYGLQKRLEALRIEHEAEKKLAAEDEAAFEQIRSTNAASLAKAQQTYDQQRKARLSAENAAQIAADKRRGDFRKKQDSETIALETRSRKGMLDALRTIELDSEAERYQFSYENELKRETDLNKLRATANEQWFSSRQRALQEEAAAQTRIYENVNDMLMAQGYTADELMLSSEELRAKVRADYDRELAAAAEEADRLRIELEYSERLERIADLEEERERLADEERAREKRFKQKELSGQAQNIYGRNKFSLFGIGLSEEEKFNLQEIRKEAEKNGLDGDTVVAQGRLDAAMAMLAELGQKMMETGKKAAGAQSLIDTRLQGSNLNDTLGGSYWRQMDWDMSSGIGMSPFVRQEDLLNNLKNYVAKGISYNVTQRAFLQTVSEKIANTFDAADGTLLKLIRIQQADSTAVRLGMESALTSFLNSMYETSEYMSDAANAVRQGLYEASALMDSAAATELEFQSQKWLGSLYSVGFSQTTELANAFGALAAGKLSSITEGGMGNLLVLSAQRAGLGLGDILQKGLDESDTNRLFNAMVEYLSEIYAETHDSKVLSQEYAKVFGLAASDLKAIANLAPSLSAVESTNMTNKEMLAQLKSMSNTMFLRTSMGEMLDTAFENFSYTMSSSLYNNPMLYATYQIASLLKSAGGGGNIPFINIKGFGLDLNTTLADLLTFGAVGGSALGGIGKLVSGLFKGSGGGFSGSGMLKAFGVDFDNGISVLQRGEPGLLTTTKGATVSESGFAGNENSEDIKKKTVDEASADGKKQIAEAKAEDEDIKIKQLDEHVLDIYNLLLDFAVGTRQMNVKISTSGMPSSWTTAHWLGSN